MAICNAGFWGARGDVLRQIFENARLERVAALLFPLQNVICGKCVAVSLSPVKRRAKNLILQTDSGKIKIILRSRMVKVKEGAAIKLYVARNTPVYEDNDLQMLYTYIAIELK